MIWVRSLLPQRCTRLWAGWGSSVGRCMPASPIVVRYTQKPQNCNFKSIYVFFMSSDEQGASLSLLFEPGQTLAVPPRYCPEVPSERLHSKPCRVQNTHNAKAFCLSLFRASPFPWRAHLRLRASSRCSYVRCWESCVRQAGILHWPHRMLSPTCGGKDVDGALLVTSDGNWFERRFEQPERAVEAP
jgi:hypothetical protein